MRSDLPRELDSINDSWLQTDNLDQVSMCVCVCVCVCVCLYVCVCVCVCMYVCNYVRELESSNDLWCRLIISTKSVCVCTCVYVCMYVCVCIYVCMYICMYLCIQSCPRNQLVKHVAVKHVPVKRTAIHLHINPHQCVKRIPAHKNMTYSYTCTQKKYV